MPRFDMKVAFHTLGCKVNQYETEAMREQFAEAGFEPVDERAFADVYVINTCTVTNLADRKSRQYIRRMKRLNPAAIVAVTGCYAQTSPEELARMPEVDIVAGTGEKNNIFDYVTENLKRRQTSGSAGHGKNPAETHIISWEKLCEYQDSGVITSMESRTRAYIKIEEGCDRFCSYCLIPFARGHVRSRDPRQIVKEAGVLTERGFKELILTGINTALYGTEKSFTEKYPDFRPELYGVEKIIAELDQMPGDFRIRLSSLEPAVVDADYAAGLLKYGRLCHHLHLSAQSGSDRVLRLMNRPYSRGEYLEIVRRLREKDPGYGITTDLIAGFPQETDEDFEDSLRLIEEAGFGKVHPFPYSSRKGTRAESMPGHVRDKIKSERAAALSKTAEAAARRFLEERTGERRVVLFEEFTGDGFVTGYTDNYIKVYARGNEINCFKEVRLLEIYKDGMKGEI